MKRFLAYLPLLALMACGGGADPEPDISGTYEMTEYVTPGAGGSGTVTYTFPYTNPQNNLVYTGKVKVVKSTESRLGIVYTIGVEGRTSLTDSLTLSIRSGGGQFQMYDGNTKVGTVDATSFLYDSRTQVGTQTLQFIIKAKK
ncbi:hypothetical protein [Spirosoma rhododendri]|uniref:Lipocalin-like domain-containing protein n=1 Tax=Spirosoma rhododendri TaxID=2728024 RepID=A0A7L5DN91_9BACT|nr:hypothetical protein [Spirosoma rhododendri]QJD77220.1 hypothetical protein HH216_01380 [Spirosoma rhododendri]